MKTRQLMNSLEGEKERTRQLMNSLLREKKKRSRRRIEKGRIKEDGGVTCGSERERGREARV